MGRLQQMIGAFALASSAALGGGCTTLHPFAQPAETPKGPSVSETRADSEVQQASAKVPAAAPSASIAALAKASSASIPKDSAADIVLAWQNKVAQLPDPTRNGAMNHGVVGQLFLFTPDSKVAAVNGKLTVEMFDQADGKRLGTWTFEKDVLKRMVTSDERFGKCIALFLLWPEYDPNVTRVKLTARYDPEKGYPLFAPVATLTFDARDRGEAIHTKRTVSGVDAAGFGGLPPATPNVSQPPPPLNPLPVGGRNAQSLPPVNPATGANLPPLVIIRNGN